MCELCVKKSDNRYDTMSVTEQVIREVNELREQNAILREALERLSKSAIVLSPEYLACFDDYKDNDGIQGWEKSRWLKLLSAHNFAKEALQRAGGGE